MGRARRTHENKDERIKGFGRKTKNKQPLGGSRCGWEDNIKIGFKEIVLDDTD
jgi:hypothetical protein